LGAKFLKMEIIYKIKEKDIINIAICVTNMLIEKGLVMDGTDSDNQVDNEEKDMQDEITAVLNDYISKCL
jgi:hypothetical protein